jgi:tyrosinase
VDKALLAKLPEIQARLFVLFSSYKDFNSFGNKAWAVSQNLSSLDSIEAIHDIIHIYGGLNGHMTYVPLSSFDPLFFIHHVSMDRLIAMWQVLNPTAWIIPMPAGETSYTTLKGTLQTSSTPLTPFYIFEDGTFWDSDMARYTTTFGYAYADTDPTHLRGESHAASLNRKITNWYGGSSAGALAADKAYRPGASKLAIKHHSHHTLHNDVADVGHYTEWMVNVLVNSGALDGSFSIHFYLGEAPSGCRKWNTPNAAGSVDFFTMSGMSGHQSPKVSGSLPLTFALVQKLGEDAIIGRPDPTADYLRKALQFRVCKGDRTEADPSSVEGLYIEVSSADVELAASEAELPRWAAPVARFALV